MSDAVTFIDPILRGNQLAHTVLRLVEDSDPTPPHGIDRPLLRCRAEFVGTPERIVNEFMRPWLGDVVFVSTEPAEAVFGDG